MKNKIVKYVPKTTESFLIKRMKDEKANGYIKKGTFTNEVVWGNYSYIIPCMTKKNQISFKKGMFLFGMVRKDANNYLKNYEIRLPKKYGQIEYNNKDLEDIDVKVTGTDLNHAYWRIAFNLGIISDRTYEKGLNDNFKSVRLAALSTLGGRKKYQKIINGEITDEYYVIEGDEDLRKIYTLIRYTCYRYMTQVRRMLGSDFLCYKTDCIYYIDSTENRAKVRNFFKEKDLLMKQLE
jgi:hypothetical protein